MHVKMTRLACFVGKSDCKFSYLNEVNTNFNLIFDSLGKEDSFRNAYVRISRMLMLSL